MGIADGVENRSSMQDLFLFLAERFGIRNFVETGTFRGDTARFASKHFSRVVTIEGAESLYQQAKRRLSDCPNIECLCGDSRTHLGNTLRDLTGPSIFWLDAHWSGGETFGEKAECPLMDELDAIYSTTSNSFTIIDDARFFVSVPPAPHNIGSWPTYFDIAGVVRQRAPHTWMTLHADAIVLAPQWASEALIAYLRQPRPVESSRRRNVRWFPWSRGERKTA